MSEYLLIGGGSSCHVWTVNQKKLFRTSLKIFNLSNDTLSIDTDFVDIAVLFDIFFEWFWKTIENFNDNLIIFFTFRKDHSFKPLAIVSPIIIDISVHFNRQFYRCVRHFSKIILVKTSFLIFFKDSQKTWISILVMIWATSSSQAFVYFKLARIKELL